MRNKSMNLHYSRLSLIVNSVPQTKSSFDNKF